MDMENKRKERDEKEKQRVEKRKERDEKEFKRLEREWLDHETQREKDIKALKEDLISKLKKRKEDLDFDDTDDKSRRRKIRSRDSRRQRQREYEDDIREFKREKDMEENRKRELARKEAEERIRIENERKARENPEGWSYGNYYGNYESSKAGLETNRDAPISVSFSKTKKKIDTASVPVFTYEEPEQVTQAPKKKTITKLEPIMKKDIATVINTIPSKKEDLFSFIIDWKIVKQFDIIEKTMKPWLKKMTVEFLGEEEEAFVSFICKKLEEEKSSNEMVSLMLPFLDDDAEEFVIRMWRMLICCIKMEID